MSEFLNQQSLRFILIAAGITAVIFRIIPPLNYPFRLFFTMIHEMGHVLTTRLTGGEILEFLVRSDGSGVAKREGGDDLVVVPAGYLGVALFSASLILLSGFPTVARFSLGVIGVIFVLLVLQYGYSTFLTAFVGLMFGLGLCWIAWGWPAIWSVFVLNLFAVMGILISLDDILLLRQLVPENGSDGTDDASKMAQRVGCSPMFWATVWFFCSAVMIGTSIWFTWLRDVTG